MNKLIIFIILFVVVQTANGQMLIEWPTKMFQDAMDFAEEKAQWVEENTHNAKQLIILKQQLERADSLKRKTEQSYKLANTVYEETKRYEGLINAGFPGLIYGIEEAINKPLNPGYYIPNVGEKSKEYKKLLNYNASSETNVDARIVIRDILKVTPEGEEKELRWTKPGKELLGLWGLLDDAEDQAELDRIAQELELARQLDALAKKMIPELLKESNINMSESDRMIALLKMYDIMKQAQDLRESAIARTKEQIEKATMSPEKAERCQQKATEWHVNNLFLTRLQYKIRNPKMSLYNYERNR